MLLCCFLILIDNALIAGFRCATDGSKVAKERSTRVNYKHLESTL